MKKVNVPITKALLDFFSKFSKIFSKKTYKDHEIRIPIRPK